MTVLYPSLIEYNTEIMLYKSKIQNFKSVILEVLNGCHLYTAKYSTILQFNIALISTYRIDKTYNITFVKLKTFKNGIYLQTHTCTYAQTTS